LSAPFTAQFDAEIRMHAADLMPIVAPCCEMHGAHVIDILLRGRQGKPVIEIFIDAENGVTSEICSAVSREVAVQIDASQEVVVPQSYTLIVSSPGIDRPLQHPWQYRKHLGRKVLVRFKSGTGIPDAVGKLLAVTDEGITIEIGKEHGQSLIRFAEIATTTVVAPW
jgi:ribosome maturation factor RimP